MILAEHQGPWTSCLLSFECFSFSLIWDHMEKENSNYISKSIQQIHSQKFMYTPKEDLYQSCSKNCEISFFFYFCQFLFFFVSMVYVGVNISNDISAEIMHQIAPPNSCIFLGRVSTRVVKRIEELWTFGNFFFFFVLFLPFNMIVNGELYNMRDLENGWS